MAAYYNEIDPYAAQWLRNLIAAGHIAAGEVDTRSIEDVHPSDLEKFTQCHFFAGIGVWSLALRRAGWADDRPVWTGSCPCQPFSAAGKGAGFADERHLWPHFHWLIGERRPAVVLGEQVASSDVNPWIDLVQDDLEGLGYRVGAVPFPSAGVGAPHIRDRLYWAADAGSAGSSQQCRQRFKSPRPAKGSAAVRLADTYGSTGGQGCADIRGRAHGGDAQSRAGLGGSSLLGGLADTSGARLEKRVCIAGISGGPTGRGTRQAAVGTSIRDAGGMAHADGGYAGAERQQCGGQQRQQPQDGGALQAESAGPTNGFWRDADWLGCRDGKWRPVEPGTFPLAHGAPARVGRLRAYGNAINAEAARVFIEAVMECQPC